MKKLLSLILSAVIITASLLVPLTAFGAEENRVENIINNMTLTEKINQMLMVEIRKWTDSSGNLKDFTVMNKDVQSLIESHNFGSVIYFAQNVKTTENTFNLTLALQSAATKNGGIPMLIAIDQEGGIIYRLGSGTAMPGNMALNATGDPQNAFDSASVIGKELISLGINTDLAPVVDVCLNPNNPSVGLRSFGDNAKDVSTYGASYAAGLKSQGVIACLKHFPGHGDTAVDSHYGLPVVNKSKDELIKTDLLPYKNICNNADMVMTAHILFPQLEKDKIKSEKTGVKESLPATLSDDIVTGILKNEFGFKGIVVTDAMNMAGVSDNWSIKQACKIAINAGVDMICMPVSLTSNADVKALDKLISELCSAVNKGEIPLSRVDDAVRRILTVKEKNGILDFDKNNFTLENARATVGSKANRDIERKISANAVTLLKNKNDLLPLKLTEKSKVLMVGASSKETGLLAMGWNRGKEKGTVPKGALVKIMNYTSDDGVVLSSKIRNEIDKADIVITVSEISSPKKIGTYSYTAPLNVLKYASLKGKKSVLISADLPFDTGLLKDNADGVIAVYGCKGTSVDPTEALVGGVTESELAFGPNIAAGVEVILGVFGARGKLPVNVYGYNTATGKFDTSKVIYKRGSGLTYCPVIDGHTDENADGLCDYCGEISNNELYEQSQISGVKITLVKDSAVGYKSRVRLEAKCENMPENHILCLCEGGKIIAKGNENSLSYTSSELTESVTYTCKILNENGKIVSGKNAEKSVTVKVKTNVFSRLGYLIKKLFKKDNIVVLTY